MLFWTSKKAELHEKGDSFFGNCVQNAISNEEMTILGLTTKVTRSFLQWCTSDASELKHTESEKF